MYYYTLFTSFIWSYLYSFSEKYFLSSWFLDWYSKPQQLPLFDWTKQTLQKKTVGFIPWEIIKKPWDLSVLFFSAPFFYPFWLEKNNVLRNVLRLTKQVWIWTRVGDRWKLACEDEEECLLPIACSPKICWNIKAIWLGHWQS